ncbi:tRNA pseudouridine(55) synthase TruB [Enterobacteriaceae endosymbiont of Donacia tomentosa]|uniref:tRNA pseudouridine(55) synthase TruB n=1 Tax=Enterobacteriaceae endosymbiont of Donacia tomentosa TaxID=2675787 RepID=UPI001449D86A|nr:tRNA pseudouridine(55) synthase TruB [Enterobacteriaceae endosymbiont of Donacia tomentosa]QJC31740.1 tRNA pseudouridine(55) synthase TruB [Enterobacteriaceae endosymbiont of Donacia tomentosa]
MIKIIKKKNINGLLLIDKSIGFTSNKILQRIKFIFKVKKAGHTGTLDPLASGLLPICLGECTKFSSYLINADKIYIVTALLGEKTDTADKDGMLIKKTDVNISKIEVMKVLQLFHGRINQIPPMYSAIKYKGTPLYKYARLGINFSYLKKRKITIYQIKLLAFDKNKIKLKIYCSKGTYIRSIIDELGDKLNCGAHIIKLRRLKISHISVFNKNVITLEQLKFLIKNYQNNQLNISLIYKLLLPIDYMISNLPKLYLSYRVIYTIKCGQKVKIKKIFIITQTIFRIFEFNSLKFVGICIIDKTGYIIKHKLVNYVI